MATSPRTPVLVLSLIFTLLCLSMAAIALIVYFNANRPDSAAIAAACKSEVGTAIEKEANKIAGACENTGKIIPTEYASVPGNQYYPGFSLPSMWSASIHPDLSSKDPAQKLVDIFNTSVIYSCTECDGGISPTVSIVTEPRKTMFPAFDFSDPVPARNLPKFQAYLKSYYDKTSTNSNSYIKNVTVKQTFASVSNWFQSTPFVVESTEGTVDGFIAEHKVIRYFLVGDTDITRITFNDWDGKSSAGWNELLASFDASTLDKATWFVGQ